jgi:hypothetical protein
MGGKGLHTLGEGRAGAKNAKAADIKNIKI